MTSDWTSKLRKLNPNVSRAKGSSSCLEIGLRCLVSNGKVLSQSGDNSSPNANAVVMNSRSFFVSRFVD